MFDVPSSGEDDYYTILGVSKTATKAEIRKAYKKLALQLHPDKHDGESQKEAAKEAFVRMQNAYEVIVDPEKRREYDLKQNGSTSPQSDNTNGSNKQHERSRSPSGFDEEDFFRSYYQQSQSGFRPQADERSREPPHRSSSSRPASHAGTSSDGFRTHSSSRHRAHTSSRHQQPRSGTWSQPSPKPKSRTGGNRTGYKQTRTNSSGSTSSSHGTHSASHQQQSRNSARSKPSPKPTSRTGGTRTGYKQTGSNFAGSSSQRYPQDNQNHSKAPSNPTSESQHKVFGMRIDGLPCQRCMKQGRFCHQHTDQDPACHAGNRRTSTNSSTHSHQRSQTKGASPPKQVYGVRIDGLPCQRCIQQGRYCHQHKDQDPTNGNKQRSNYSSSKSYKSSRNSERVFGICQNGLPCKRCVQQHRFCYQHCRQES